MKDQYLIDNKQKRIYMVQTMDENHIITMHGVYDNLDQAAGEIKEQYSYVGGIEDLELKEYPSTFNWCFDQEIYDEEEGSFVRIFGYIFHVDEDATELKLEIEEG